MHFGHEKTLFFVPRPFDTTHEMNLALISNWNKVVKPGDLVWNLGDFTWTQPTKFWAKKLNGHILFIRGNHDRYAKWKKHFAMIKRSGHAFVLIHDPDDRAVPHDFEGWIVHGHHHGGRDKDGNEYPFIDGVRRRINVVVELTNYRPVDLDWIVGLGLNTIKRMDNVDAIHERWNTR